MTRQRPPFLVRLLRAFVNLLVIFIVLSVILGLLALRFGPELVLRGLNFTPEGSVDAVWETIALEPAPFLGGIDDGEGESSGVVIGRLPTPTLPIILEADFTEVPIDPSPTGTPAPTHTLPAQVIVLSSPTDALSATPTNTPAETPTISVTATTDPRTAFRRITTPDILNVISPGYLDVTAPARSVYAESLIFSQNQLGERLVVAVFDEDSLDGLCAEWLNDCTHPLLKVNSVDFRPDGMIVYGTVRLTDAITRDLGVAMRLDRSEEILQFRMVGVVLDGTIYRLPATGQVAEVTRELLRRGNDALAALTLRAGEHEYALRNIVLDDDRLMIVWS